MKKIASIVALIMITGVMAAQEVQMGDLTIYSSDGQRFYFYLDDNVQNNQLTAKVILHNFTAGLHKASFRFERAEIPPFVGSIYINASATTVYTLEPDPRENGIYNLMAKLVTPFNKERRESKEYNNRREGDKKDAGQRQPEAGCMGMVETEFNQAFTTIKNKPFDDVRLTVAKEVISSNALTAKQITTICKAFNFDDSRLEFAKYAYTNCCDKNNYFVVSGAFKFSSSTDDLATFIAAQPPVLVQNNGQRENEKWDNDEKRRTRHDGDEGRHEDHDNTRNSSIGCIPMDAASFQSATNSISLKNFDDTKLDMAKQLTQANCLYADQIVQLCRLFSFEATKLDFAKYAYNYCYDKSNYFKINDVFDFESSTTELNTYIKAK